MGTAKTIGANAGETGPSQHDQGERGLHSLPSDELKSPAAPSGAQEKPPRLERHLAERARDERDSSCTRCRPTD